MIFVLVGFIFVLNLICILNFVRGILVMGVLIFNLIIILDLIFQIGGIIASSSSLLAHTNSVANFRGVCHAIKNLAANRRDKSLAKPSHWITRNESKFANIPSAH